MNNRSRPKAKSKNWNRCNWIYNHNYRTCKRTSCRSSANSKSGRSQTSGLTRPTIWRLGFRARPLRQSPRWDRQTMHIQCLRLLSNRRRHRSVRHLWQMKGSDLQMVLQTMIYLSNWIRIRSRIKTWEIGLLRRWNSRCLHRKTFNKNLKIKRSCYKNKFLLASYLIAFNHFRNKSLAWISS